MTKIVWLKLYQWTPNKTSATLWSSRSKRPKWSCWRSSKDCWFRETCERCDARHVATLVSRFDATAFFPKLFHHIAKSAKFANTKCRREIGRSKRRKGANQHDKTESQMGDRPTRGQWQSVERNYEDLSCRGNKSLYTIGWTN